MAISNVSGNVGGLSLDNASKITNVNDDSKFKNFMSPMNGDANPNMNVTDQELIDTLIPAHHIDSGRPSTIAILSMLSNNIDNSNKVG